jgi:hypothetical protein
MTSRRYFWSIVALVAATVSSVIALNLLLLLNDYRFDKNRLASEWQQQSGGVTYAPPINNNRAFKTLRLHDRLHEIDTLVFGSSTAMGLTADALTGHRVYNFAQSGNGLWSVTGEAEYVIRHWGGRIRTLFIPLDWSLGFIYAPARMNDHDLSIAAVSAGPRPPVPVMLREALAMPRVIDLAGILRDILLSRDKGVAFRRFFLEAAGPVYACPDGTPAKDFDTVYRGLCTGFRADGSATFADQKRVSQDTAAVVLARAASASSQYAGALAKTGGQPSEALMNKLSGLIKLARTKGVQTVFFLPPLLPGLDERLAKSAHAGIALARTRQALAQWAAAESVVLIDAGRSERYGCEVIEFVDAHHALPACYRKIFNRQAGLRSEWKFGSKGLP